MRRTKWLLALVLCSAASVPPASAGDTAIVNAGRIIFESRCRVCHADDPGLRSYGPPLVGVIGRQAGSFPGYVYSEALKNAGITWTLEAVRAWMANNDAMMPGTKMRHVGVTDPAEQDLILSYLESISN
jgi:cytochrome c